MSTLTPRNPHVDRVVRDSFARQGQVLTVEFHINLFGPARSDRLVEVG